jgi:short-subunit dehydrogenase involved in D-alanine esterification of teichoic acids
VVYLTGRDPARVPDALATVTAARSEVHGAVVDVSDAGAVARFAELLARRHGQPGDAAENVSTVA